MLSNDNKILFGDEIIQYYRSELDQDKNATVSVGEPMSYSFSGEMSNMMSDKYSYLDQNSDDYIKGNGGLRQMHAFTKKMNLKIDTPPEDYIKERIASNKLKNYEETRNKDINLPKINIKFILFISYILKNI